MLDPNTGRFNLVCLYSIISLILQISKQQKTHSMILDVIWKSTKWRSMDSCCIFLGVILPPLHVITQRDTNKSKSIHVCLNIHTGMQNEITESTREWKLKCVTT